MFYRLTISSKQSLPAIRKYINRKMDRSALKMTQKEAMKQKNELKATHRLHDTTGAKN